MAICIFTRMLRRVIRRIKMKSLFAIKIYLIPNKNISTAFQPCNKRSRWPHVRGSLHHKCLAPPRKEYMLLPLLILWVHFYSSFLSLVLNKTTLWDLCLLRPLFLRFFLFFICLYTGSYLFVSQGLRQHQLNPFFSEVFIV